MSELEEKKKICKTAMGIIYGYGAEDFERTKNDIEKVKNSLILKIDHLNKKIEKDLIFFSTMAREGCLSELQDILKENKGLILEKNTSNYLYDLVELMDCVEKGNSTTSPFMANIYKSISGEMTKVSLLDLNYKTKIVKIINSKLNNFLNDIGNQISSYKSQFMELKNALDYCNIFIKAINLALYYRNNCTISNNLYNETLYEEIYNDIELVYDKIKEEI